jgi:hypothetical protein
MASTSMTHSIGCAPADVRAQHQRQLLRHRRAHDRQAHRAQPAMRATVRSIVGAGALHGVHHRPVPRARCSKSGIRPQLGRAFGSLLTVTAAARLHNFGPEVYLHDVFPYCRAGLETGTSSSLRTTGASRALGSIASSSIARSAGSRSLSDRCRQCCRATRSRRSS